MLLRHPSLPRGRNDDHVSLVDVLATLRDIAGLEPQPELPGRSLLADLTLVRALDAALRLILDPDATDERAKADQAERLATSTRG